MKSTEKMMKLNEQKRKTMEIKPEIRCHYMDQKSSRYKFHNNCLVFWCIQSQIVVFVVYNIDGIRVLLLNEKWERVCKRMRRRVVKNEDGYVEKESRNEREMYWTRQAVESLLMNASVSDGKAYRLYQVWVMLFHLG